VRILVTGATGFIGRSLCNRLTDAGHEVAAVSRDPLTAAARLGTGSAAHGGPRLHAGLTVHGSLAAAWAACTAVPYDAVINLAGAPIAEGRWTPERKRILRASRVDLARELADLITRSPVQPAVLISASASGYYGDASGRELDESAPAGQGFLADLCREWEQAALAAGGAGVRVCIARLGLVLGPGGGLIARLLPLFRAGLGGRLGSGRQWMPWIHRDDVIGLITHLLQRGDLSGAFNVAAPTPVTNAEFTRALARAVRRPALVAVPAVALRIAFGEMGGMLTASQRMVPRRALAEGYRFAFPELGEALKGVVE
jgi:uncharacterized protein (TIGR01777 family)